MLGIFAIGNSFAPQCRIGLGEQLRDRCDLPLIAGIQAMELRPVDFSVGILLNQTAHLLVDKRDKLFTLTRTFLARVVVRRKHTADCSSLRLLACCRVDALLHMCSIVQHYTPNLYVKCYRPALITPRIFLHVTAIICDEWPDRQSIAPYGRLKSCVRSACLPVDPLG